MFNFKKASKPFIKLCLGTREGDELTDMDWSVWPEDFPIPSKGDFVQSGSYRAEVMWVDYDYFYNKIHIFAGLIK